MENFLMRRLMAFIAALMVTVTVGGTTASADVGSPDGTTRADSKHLVPTKDVGVQAVCPIWRYGYYGEYMCYSTVFDADWEGSPETFVIAPNRTIWHAWPGSGGWHEMPGGGRADDMEKWGWGPGHSRVVGVAVFGVFGVFCNADPEGPAGWTGWWRCE